jgi:CRISPR/Cas system-associated exonuclease Cas4 (RecB family)
MDLLEPSSKMGYILTDLQRRRLTQLRETEDDLRNRFVEAKQIRFNIRGLAASIIAEQYYCEKKVEMQQQFGRVETETKLQGLEAHESLLAEAEEVTREQLLEEILSGQPVVAHEMPLMARHGDIFLVGQPDAILFRDGDPLLVIEAKFSNSRFPYPSYHAQAKVYGTMLDSLGFDTSYLFYAIAVMPREELRDARLFSSLVDAIRENGLSEATLRVGGGYVYLYEFNLNEARNCIDWAIDYWNGEREAQPTDNPNKCRSCEYRENCKSA